MKYIKESEYNLTNRFGIVTGCLYLFFTYLSGSIFIPSWVNRGTLIVFLACGIVTTIVKIYKGTYKLRMISIWQGIMIAYTLLSFVYSENPAEIYSNHFYQMGVCFVITLFLCAFLQSEKDFSWICWSYVLSSLVMIILLYKSGKLIGDYNERLGNEVSGNANIFATFMMYSTLYALWLLIYQKNKKAIKILLIVVIILNLYALMLSAGRKFFLIPFIFLFVLLMFHNKNKTSFVKNALKSIILLLPIFVIVYYLIIKIPMLYNAIGIRFETLLNSITGRGAVDESTLIRSYLRSAAISGWLEKPILGHGFNTFYLLNIPKLINHHMYSHCNYTEMLYNGGLVGFAFYYWFFAFIIWKSYKFLKINTKWVSFTMAALISQLVLDYGGVFYDIVITQVFLMMAVQALEIFAMKEIPMNKTESGYQYEKGLHYIRSNKE